MTDHVTPVDAVGNRSLATLGERLDARSSTKSAGTTGQPTFPVEFAEGERGALQRVVLPVLSQSQLSTETLWAWCEGKGLPTLERKKPAELIFAGLPTTNRARAEQILMKLVAAALKDEYGQSSRGIQRPEAACIGLYELAAKFEAPQELGQPLFNLLDRRYHSDAKMVALREALIPNQVGTKLKTFWYDMLAGKNDLVLPGSKMDGFRGVLAMPSEGRARGPNWPAIGHGLRCMALDLATQPKRQQRFGELIEKIGEAYPDVEDYQDALREFGRTEIWPVWAREVLG